MEMMQINLTHTHTKHSEMVIFYESDTPFFKTNFTILAGPLFLWEPLFLAKFENSVFFLYKGFLKVAVVESSNYVVIEEYSQTIIKV